MDRLRINSTQELLEWLDRRLDRIDQHLFVLTRIQELELQDISELQADVTAEGTVIDSAVVLLNGISQRLLNAGVDPAALAALAADITAHTQALSAAVAAGTPAAPPATVAVPPVVEPPVVPSN